MPPVPALSLHKAGAHHVSPSEDSTLSMSARHILKPQVGVSAMISALGDMKPLWEQRSLTARSSAGTPTTPTPRSSRTPRTPVRPGQSAPGYHVGRMRVREQLSTALGTQDEAAQLRRLEQALESPARYDKGCRQNLKKASDTAALLSRRFCAFEAEEAAAAAPPPAARVREIVSREEAPPAVVADGGEELPEGAQEEQPALGEDVAASRIQNKFRERKERERERRKKEEQEDAAALRIQTLYRGNAARTRVQQQKVRAKRASSLIEVMEEEENGEQEQEGNEDNEDEEW